ncbi:hypothetical protein A4V04_13280 [Burkholderiales bacterium YL45]|uniref:DUF4372 domain-containing protein n=1 Tax=Turicimonas muris TaxID=1796652 RepID=A0A227KIA9_9BURK|nr:DUF4372 domain-containing protein [Turicimonas muris]ARE60874.1 hypothetical protein A4V04_13280 [Burkholderiales bacterium YL45]OXE47339.1 hypothetical protein ADH67_09295 [Turicimonas muris]QQQ97841.1 DUF4372 domain-containing protein [Turicimonas muris]
MFAQLVQSLNCKLEFNNLVQKHGSCHGAKGLTSWSQFVAMLFASLPVLIH